MTKHTSAASLPATELITSAHHLLAARRNKAIVQNWLTQLGLHTPDELLSPSPAVDWNDVLSLLIAEHRAHNPLATAVLLAGQSRMIAKVSLWAHGDSVHECFNTTVEAFLSQALTRAPLSHRHLGEQLYWITLRSVRGSLKARRIDCAPLTVDLEDRHDLVALDDYLTADSILGWAHSQQVINDDDARVLVLRFAREQSAPVREIAAELGVNENALESRLRRLVGRLRNHILANMSAFEHACLSDSYRVPVCLAVTSNREQFAA